MSRRGYSFLVLFCLPLLASLAAAAQQPEPTFFTFVAEWNVPRNQWDAFTANFSKNLRPVLDRLSADGTLVSWGSFDTVVHTPEQMTHGVWFQATSIGAIERARNELLKIPPDPSLAAATAHRDYLLRSLLLKARAAAPSGGYLWVGSSVVKPGKGQEWRALWEKYNKAFYDELLGNGTITYYAVDVEHVHTEDPGLRFVVYITPTADGIDKVNAAIVARNQKRSAEEGRAIGDAFAELLVPGAHRDLMARVLLYWHK